MSLLSSAAFVAVPGLNFTWRMNLPVPCSKRAGSRRDRKSTRLNSSHLGISYAVFCLKKITKAHEHDATPRRAVHPPPGGQERVRALHHPLLRADRAASLSFFFNNGAPPEIYPFPLPAPLQI